MLKPGYRPAVDPYSVVSLNKSANSFYFHAYFYRWVIVFNLGDLYRYIIA